MGRVQRIYRRLGKIFRLSRSDRQLLLHTFLLLNAVRLGLWLLPFRTLTQLLEALSPTPVQRSATHAISIIKIIRSVDISSRYSPGRVKCLARALTAQVLLHGNGYAAHLHIGVAKGEYGQLEAHAWIESQGTVVMGELQNLSRYTPLPISPSMLKSNKR
jgi:hypothetical protein